MADEKKPFWETLPGILTGVAAVITALGGLVALFVRPASKQAPVAEPEVAVAASTHPKKHRLSVVNVEGNWRDTILGNRVYFAQQGNSVTTQTIYPATGQRLAVGSGQISGRTMSGSYVWYDGSTYQATLVVSDDGQTITGTYRNALTGESGAVNLVR